MSVEEYWRASDGTKLFYCYDDFTDPWKPPATLLMLHSAMSSARRFYFGGSAGGYTAQQLAIHHPERRVTDTLAFLKRRFPQEPN